MFFCKKGGKEEKKTQDTFMRFCFRSQTQVRLNLKKVRDWFFFHCSLHPSFISSSVHLSQPSLCQAPGGLLAVLLTPGSGSLRLLTTCCRQIVLSVLVHYCTFCCFSQHIKCIKDQWNSATNKDSTTADRVDGWSSARGKFDPLCIMFLCVCT